MKVSFNKNFITPDGNEGTAKISEQLGKVLFSLDSTEKLNLTAEEKYKAYKIGRDLRDNDGEIDLTVEDAAFLKKVCAVCFVSGAYGQIVDTIERM